MAMPSYEQAMTTLGGLAGEAMRVHDHARDLLLACEAAGLPAPGHVGPRPGGLVMAAWFLPGKGAAVRAVVCVHPCGHFSAHADVTPGWGQGLTRDRAVAWLRERLNKEDGR